MLLVSCDKCAVNVALSLAKTPNQPSTKGPKTNSIGANLITLFPELRFREFLHGPAKLFDALGAHFPRTNELVHSLVLADLNRL